MLLAFSQFKLTQHEAKMTQVDIAANLEFYEDCAALVGRISRLTLASESNGAADTEDGPASFEWLVSNHEALESLILDARKLVP
jgi:hypothetical protein